MRTARPAASMHHPLHHPARRRLARTAGASLVIAAGLLALGATPAFADCPATDPSCLGTTIGGVGGTVGNTIGDATSTAGAGQVGDTVNGVVDPIVHQVTDVIDGALGSGPVDPPGGGDKGGGTGGGSHGGRGGPPGNGGGSTPAKHDAPGSSGGSGSTRGIRFASLPGNGVFATSGSGSRGIAERIGDAIGHAAGKFGFPVALSLLVLLFVAVQHHLDRRDPKLASAPSAPDVVRFV